MKTFALEQSPRISDRLVHETRAVLSRRWRPTQQPEDGVDCSLLAPALDQSAEQRAFLLAQFVLNLEYLAISRVRGTDHEDLPSGDIPKISRSHY